MSSQSAHFQPANDPETGPSPLEDRVEKHHAREGKHPEPASGGNRSGFGSTVQWQATRTGLKNVGRSEQSPKSAAEVAREDTNARHGTTELTFQEKFPERRSSPKRNATDSPGHHHRGRENEPGPTRRKQTKQPMRRVGGGRKPDPVDPDFDRSVGTPREVDDAANRTPKKLFNPHRDDPSTFKPHGPAQETQSPQPTRPRQGSRPSAGILQKDQPPQTISIVRRESNAAVTQPKPTPPKSCDIVQESANPNETEARLRMVRQPETRPISTEQLIAEVKGIYAGLIMVEAKCCEVDAKQHQAALEMDGNQSNLNNEQWQALIALHRTLLHEHHDFFLASQHPSASQSLKKLAHKYAMPARMWRHGIHSFLELLRHRLPHSLEHMLTFIYLAYSMMALLYETVPAFENTWIECLGDLARYRMAIEDNDPRDREVWQNVARSWYSKAADKTPYVGRLYHHLAILARPNLLQQLFFYCKSLGVSQPFTSARESILTVFDPIFNPEVFGVKSQPVDASFIQLHSITFTHIEFEKFDMALDEFLDLLDKHMGEQKWKVQGFYMAVCNITALYQYGSRDSLLRKACKEDRQTAVNAMDEAPADADDTATENAMDTLLPPYGTDDPTEAAMRDEKDEIESESAAITQSIQGISLSVSKRLGFQVLQLTLERLDDPNVMPHWHAWMVFLVHIVKSPSAIRLLENDFPWEGLVAMLNELRSNYDGTADKIEGSSFPAPDKGVGRPLPEDYNLRGFDWARFYFPDRWFEDAQIDNEERHQELPSMTDIRVVRILWLAMRICAVGDYIKYDSQSMTFAVHPALESRKAETQKRAEAAAQRGMKKEEHEETADDFDADVEMTHSESEDYVMVVPENVRKLKERKRQLEAQLQAGTSQGVVTAETIAEVSGAAIVKGPESLDRNITAFIVDTNLLVSHLETFSLITSKSWAVIIPNCVITELHGLGKNAGSLGDSAKSAMIAINKAIADRKDVKIITARGNDLTKVGFFKEKLEKDDDETRNIDDVIIRTTEEQAQLRRQAFTQRGITGYDAETAILLTEDTNMRVKANARRVPAISTTILKRFLVQLDGGAGGRQQRKAQPRTKAASPRTKRKSVPPAIMTRIKSEYHDDEDLPMVDVPDPHSELKTKAPKKRAKRGRTAEDTQQYAQAR